MRKVIVLFNGQSQYDVLRYFISDLSNAFCSLGYNTIIIDLLKENWVSELEKVIRTQKILFFLSMNGMGVDINIDGKFLFDKMKVPLVALFVDHPYYHLDRINYGVKNLVVLCVDKTHVDFLSQYAQIPFTKAFIPHGSTLNSSKIDESLPICKRNIDIMFTGSYTDPDSIRESWMSLGTYVKKMIDEMIEYAVYQNEKPLINILEQIFQSKNIDPSYGAFSKICCLLPQVDHYVRSRRRKEVIESLSDLQLHVYGNGWTNLKNLSKSSIKFHEAINFHEAQDKMKNSKIVLTILPYFTHGGHERIFTSMLNGAVSLSDRNTYLESTFKNEESILFFDLGNNSLSKDITNVLEDKNKLQNIADNGKKISQSNHTWENRAQSILEVVEIQEAFCR